MIFIILCGGSGTRLWPISKKQHPKQFHRFVTPYTLLQDTILRVSSLEELNEDSSYYYFVTNQSFLNEVEKNILELEIPTDKYTILLEPFGQNSFPAILLATIFSLQLNRPDEYICVMSSDHKWDDRRFCEMIQKSNLEKYKDRIITLGIQPTTPHTGYGYIKKNNDELSSIVEFKEKPDKETAERYIESGEYLWNSGTFIYLSDVFLKAVEEFEPESLSISQLNFQNIHMIKENVFLFDKEEFRKFPNISIDYAIMEKITNGTVLSFDSTWSDIGSFDAIYELLPKNENENVFEGDSIIDFDTHDCFIMNQQKNHIISTVGCSDLVIIHTNDVTLIMNKNECQNIKKIIEKIQNNESLLSYL